MTIDEARKLPIGTRVKFAILYFSDNRNSLRTHVYGAVKAIDRDGILVQWDNGSHGFFSTLTDHSSFLDRLFLG